MPWPVIEVLVPNSEPISLPSRPVIPPRRPPISGILDSTLPTPCMALEIEPATPSDLKPVTTPVAELSAPLVRTIRLVSPPRLASMLRSEASMADE